LFVGEGGQAANFIGQGWIATLLGEIGKVVGLFFLLSLVEFRAGPDVEGQLAKRGSEWPAGLDGLLKGRSRQGVAPPDIGQARDPIEARGFRSRRDLEFLQVGQAQVRRASGIDKIGPHWLEFAERVGVGCQLGDEQSRCAGDVFVAVIDIKEFVGDPQVGGHAGRDGVFEKFFGFGEFAFVGKHVDQREEERLIAGVLIVELIERIGDVAGDVPLAVDIAEESDSGSASKLMTTSAALEMA